MAMHAGGAIGQGEPNADINTTPLIDVLLVLLIMFIVTLPPQRHAVKLASPATSEKPLAEPPSPVRIGIDFDGALTWNGSPLLLAELDPRLAVQARRPQQAEIHIEPNRLASYAEVIHVMAAVQREGLTKLGVIGGT
jgi:biopolymer transport protein ExbD